MNARALRFALATSAGQAAAALLTIPLSMLASELGADGGDGVATALAIVMVAVGVLEGVITGAAQSLALRGLVAPSRFIARTSLGFGLGWMLGAASSLVESPGGDPRLFVLGAALAQGVVLGTLVGLLVAPLMTDDRRGRLRIVVGQASGWGAALLVAVLATAFASSQRPLVEIALGVARGALVGLVCGSIAGPFVTAECVGRESAARDA